MLSRSTPLRRTPFKKKAAKKRATASEKRHMGAVARIGCIVCWNLGYGFCEAEVHHVRFSAGTGQRAAHVDTIPLCPPHHRIGGHGIAIHAGQETWEANFGNEAELLDQVRRMLLEVA